MTCVKYYLYLNDEVIRTQMHTFWFHPTGEDVNDFGCTLMEQYGAYEFDVEVI